jgi:asparagine N-glycosylation enzyme membrane subunit Stt3
MSASNYKERLDEFLTVEGLKNNWTYLAVTGVFLFALFLRMIPEQGMQYLQALDPYMIYRMSEHLALSGNMPQVDFLRYFPYETPTYLLNQGNIVFPALMWWLGPFLVFGSFLEWAQFYPALMGAFGVVFAYLLGSELFDRKTGVFSAFMLATISGVMHRTSAGFFEKEPIGTMFMMMSLWLFTRAWQRKEYISGIGSGLALGFFTISWGGSSMLWLMYPAVIGIVLMLNQEIENLMTAYTPTVIIGGITATALNQSRFGFNSTLFQLNILLVGLLWSRYLVEEFELLDSKYLPYYTPAVSAGGAFLALLSPLYSDTIARKMMSLIDMATQDTGKVIGGTVAENTAANLGQLVSQLGANSATSIHFSLGSLATIIGSWPLAYFGGAFLLTAAMIKVLNIWELADLDLTGKEYMSAFISVFSAWTVGFIFFFRGQLLVAGLGAGLVLASYLVMQMYLDEDSLFSIASMILIFLTVGQLMAFFGGVSATFATLAPTIAALAGIGFLYYTDNLRPVNVNFNWVLVLPAFWFASNLIGAVAKSRLITLAAFPVAFVAGYGLSRIIDRLWTLDYSEVVSDIPAERVRAGVVGITLILVLAVNGASGYASANQLSGSPNELWMENLDHIRENTEEGSVILSWWDYGYHFESIARRPAVADGGNMGYYSDQQYSKVNYPIADWLTSSDPYANHTEVFEKHSVDYIVLDHTMIGKYSAVSQISNRDNSQFGSMLDMSTPNNLDNALSRSGNQTVMRFQGQGLQAYAPIDSSGSDVGVTGTVTLETGQGRLEADCLLTENGTEYFGEGNESDSRFCVAEHPFYTIENAIAAQQQGQSYPAHLVLVPQELRDSNLVKLYLQNGHGVPFAEPVPEGSNGFVRMWEVTDQE